MLNLELQNSKKIDIDDKMKIIDNVSNIYSSAAKYALQISAGTVLPTNYKKIDNFHKESVKFLNDISDFNNIFDSGFRISLIDKLNYIDGFLLLKYKKRID